MGTFTIPLKKVIELEKGRIGLDDYPIFDEDYRESLNQKIIDHYWNQEIGQETISLFTFALKRRMNEIMPAYNQQYKLSLLEADPLSTVSIKSLTVADGTSTVNGTSSSDSTSKAKSRAVASETPQTQLNPDSDYASSMQDNISDTTATGTGTEEQTTGQEGTTDSDTSGYSGHAPMLIFQARQAIVNVDMMIINDLQDLFMLIWSSGDSYSNTRNPYLGGRFYHGIY